jgi:hypothetical protein
MASNTFVRARIDEYREAGLRVPILYPLTAAAEPDHVSDRLEQTITGLAPGRT